MEKENNYTYSLLKEMLTVYDKLKKKEKFELFDFYFGKFKKIIAFFWVKKDTEINEKDLAFIKENSDFVKEAYEKFFGECGNYKHVSSKDLKKLKHLTKFIINRYEAETNLSIRLVQKIFELMPVGGIAVIVVVIYFLNKLLNINQSFPEIETETSNVLYIFGAFVGYLIFIFIQHHYNIQSKIETLKEFLELIELRMEELKEELEIQKNDVNTKE